MPQDKTISRTDRREAESAHAPDDSPGGKLLTEAEAWGRVARESHQNCEQGVDAEQELIRRRNRSGE